MLSYNQKRLKKHEIIIPVVITCLVVMMILSIRTEFFAFASFTMWLFLPLISVLFITFLIPIGFLYAANIDMGNYKNFILWLIPLVLFGWGFGHDFKVEYFLTKAPLFAFIYLHIIRIIYFLITNKAPVYGAGWFREGERDKFVDRYISKRDTLFNAFHGLLPFAFLVIWVWLEQILK